MDLWNVETGLLESIADDEAEQRYLSGTHALKKGTFANVIDREDGTVLKVPVDKVADYLKSGFNFESEAEKAIRQTRNDPENKGLVGATKAFAESAADMATIGVSGAVQEATESELDKVRREARQEENPVISTLGSITGFGISTLYGGSLLKGVKIAGTAAEQAVMKAAELGGKKVAQSAAIKLGAKIAERAVENAVIMAPKRLTEAALGDPETAAETLLSHVGEDLTFGAGFGAGEGLIVPVVKATAQLAARHITPEKLGDLADDFRLRQQGFKTQDLRAAKKAARTKSADFARDQLVDFMDNYEIGKLKTIFDAPDETWSRLEGLQKKAVGVMNKVREATDRATGGKSFASSQIAKPLRELFKQYDNTLGKQASSSYDDIKTVANMIDDIFSGKTNYIDDDTLKKLIASGRVAPEALQKGVPRTAISFEEAHALKNKIDEFVFSKNPVTQMRSNVPISDGALDARNLLTDTLDNNLGLLKDPNITRALSSAKKIYGEIENLGRKVFQASSERISTHNRFSLTDALNATIGAAAYGNIAGAIAVGAGSKAMRQYGNQLVASSLKGLASSMESASGKVDAALKRIAASPSGAVVKRSVPASVGALNRFLGDEGKDLSNADKIKLIAKQLATATANTDLTTSVLSKATQNYSNIAPEVTQAISAKFGSALEYLMAEVPKPNFETSGYNPTQWQPSDRQMSAFSRKLAAVLDPFSSLDEINDGTLTKESIQAISQVYPTLFRLMQQKITEKISTAKPEEVFRLRRKLGLFLAEPMGMSATPDKLSALQYNFRDTRNERKKIHANSKITEASRITTDTDRLANQ